MTDTAACAMPAAGTPWYRQRWPWLLMLGPAIVVVAGIVTAVIAIETDDGLVTDDYYKRGLAINQTLERAARMIETGGAEKAIALLDEREPDAPAEVPEITALKAAALHRLDRHREERELLRERTYQALHSAHPLLLQSLDRKSVV